MVQSITFRLADSIPRELIEKLEIETKLDRRIRLERMIDEGRGNCLLNDPACAGLVQQALQHFDGERYRLLAWAIMPNHVRALIEQMEGFPLGDVVHSWKSFTTKAINRRIGTRGKLWAADYFDRFIRDERHYDNALLYIENNPVKAGLVSKASDRPFSSAYNSPHSGPSP